MFFEMSFEIPCGSIQAKIWGKVGGRPVLGLHGWLDNANTFDKLAPMLPEDVHFVAIDLPGHGKSSHKPKGVNTYDWVVDIKRVVTHLGWKKFSFISHSLSAEYSLLYAGTFPQDVDKMILLDGFVPKLAQFVEAPDALAAHAKAMVEETVPKRVYPDLPSITAKVYRDIGKKFNEELQETAEILVARGVKQVPGGYMFTWDPNLRYQIQETTKSLFLSNSFEYKFEDYMSFFKRITCEVLVIFTSANRSQRSRLLSEQSKTAQHYQMAFDAIRKNGSLTIKDVPGNHYVHLNNPQVIVLLVNSFLSHSSLQGSRSKL